MAKEKRTYKQPIYRADSERNARAFLAAYRQCGTIVGAADATGFACQSHRNWMARFSEWYPDEFQAAKEEVAERLEHEAWRRAVLGVREYEFYQGLPIPDPETGKPYFKLKYSDAILLRMLAANNEKYRDRTTVDMNSKVEGKIEHKHVAAIVNLSDLLPDMPLEMKRMLLELYRKKQLEKENQPKQIENESGDE